MTSKNLAPSKTPFFPNHFIRNQFGTKSRFPPETTNLSDRVAIVTGSNTGLGLECARQLLSYKLSRLILAVRSVSRGQDAASELAHQYPNAFIEIWEVDMASYDSIRAFAARVGKELSRLDMAILNAGIGFHDFKIVPGTGHEETIQVNYLSTMLLAVLLLPSLKTKSPTGPGRLTISTAMLSMTAKFPNKHEDPLLPSFDDQKYFDASDIYATSKLLGQMFLWKLTDLVSAEDVVVNMVEPGFVKGTDLHRDRSFGTRIAVGLLKTVAARSVAVGASAYVDACAVKGEESHGCILTNWDIAPYVPFQYTAAGKDIMERLWLETMNELNFADVSGILESLRDLR